MSDPIKNFKLKIKNLPQQPGIYQFLDKDGGVIYVGKAKNLKSRVNQYFTGHDNRPQLPFLLAEAVDVNYTVVNNELESAFLENTIIKQYLPKYNIQLRDDKNYAFIKIDYSTQIPQITIARKVDSEGLGLRVQGTEKNRLSPTAPTLRPKYFGPYSAAYKIRNTLHLLRRIFPYCSAEKVSSRPCFYYYMHRCPGVCFGKISIAEYCLQIDNIAKFLQGDISGITKQIKRYMILAAKDKKFETAARLRDQLRSLQLIEEKQNVILPKKVDWDIVSIGSSDGYSCINLFKIRGGKMFDKENFVFELPELHDNGSLGPATITKLENDVLQSFLQRYYLETSSLPKDIYVQYQPTDPTDIQNLLVDRCHKKIKLTSPKKGKILQLTNLGKLNAEEYLRNWLSDQAGHLDKINKALEQLKEVLHLEKIPKRIECYDISNIQGTNAVGSMVVFVDGLPAKSQYRKFKIRGKQTPDDFAMMKEMLTRRLARASNVSAKGGSASGGKGHPSRLESSSERAETETSNVKKWPLPDLIVIDGGKGQLSAAMESFKQSSVKGQMSHVPIIGLAKRIEEIFTPENPVPIILDHNEPALQLLQRLRDEAHRFGITFHRVLRSKQAVKSALDEIPGIGPKTKKLLKTKFGTVAGVRKSTLEELTNIIGSKLALIIKQNL